jgi:preprotein translocase subunit SecE
VARDRKRGKQRRPRQVRQGAPAASPVNRPLRGDLPGSLDHASGDVDEFDAALVRGAEGVPAVPLVGDDERTQEQPGGEDGWQEGRQDGLGRIADEEPPAAQEPALVRYSGDGDEEDEEERALAVEAPGRQRGPARTGGQPLPARAAAFFRASWAELQRVQWPDRRQVFQATAVVLGFVVVAGVYLGVADWAAQKIVNFVL